MTSVICLQGAETSTRKLFDPFRKELANHEIGTVAFDFIGHGDTEGKLELTSLHSRYRQACCVIDTVLIDKPL